MQQEIKQYLESIKSYADKVAAIKSKDLHLDYDEKTRLLEKLRHVNNAHADMLSMKIAAGLK